MPLLDEIVAEIKEKNPAEPEFHQAAAEVLPSLGPTVDRHPEFVRAKIYQRLVIPDRTVIFRVPWADDEGRVQVNQGYRVQYNNAIGPYKGGLRFHPSVNLSIMKFLGFEQVFKNSLTTLPMGGAKGGADFNPRGRSDAEIMRFCQAFMRELHRHLGPDTDVPAGDIGVGEREIGYLYGYYKKLVNEHTGVLTGKGLEYGGSLMRTEATGYGAVYFCAEMLAEAGEELEGKRAAISGAGNVAQYTAEKLLAMDAEVITVSDSDGTVVDGAGMDRAKLDFLLDLKNKRRGRISEYAAEYDLPYFENQSVWDVIKQQGLSVDLAFPSATQNEINGEQARALVENGCLAVTEGANMPSTLEAVEVYRQEGIHYAPGKAANAGGVATSGLEMTQNSLRISWPREEVEQRLFRIMRNIHRQCREAAEAYGSDGDLMFGANVAGFLRVARAMYDYGVV